MPQFRQYHCTSYLVSCCVFIPARCPCLCSTFACLIATVWYLRLCRIRSRKVPLFMQYYYRCLSCSDCLVQRLLGILLHIRFSKVPLFMQYLSPPGSLNLYERAWNCYPYCRTVLMVSHLVGGWGAFHSVSVVTVHVCNYVCSSSPTNTATVLSVVFRFRNLRFFYLLLWTVIHWRT